MAASLLSNGEVEGDPLLAADSERRKNVNNGMRHVLLWYRADTGRTRGKRSKRRDSTQSEGGLHLRHVGAPFCVRTRVASYSACYWNQRKRRDSRKLAL